VTRDWLQVGRLPHYKWKSHWTITIRGKTRCVLLHFDSSKCCVCSLYKFLHAFKVVKLFLKHPVFGFPHNVQHFHFCSRTLLPTVSLSNPRYCILAANGPTEQDVFQFPKSIFHNYTPHWTPEHKQFLCVGITLLQGNGLGRSWFHTEVRKRQLPASAQSFISVCFICTSNSQATIVSPLKWKTLRFFNRHD